MEDAADIPPRLQPQLPATTRCHTSSHFLNSDTFIIFLLLISLCFIFLVIFPPFHSLTFQFMKPHSMKKNLDFLSLVLIFFAIACGFLSRNKEENTIHRSLNSSEQTQIPNSSSTPHQWHQYSDQTDQNLVPQTLEIVGNEQWRISNGHYITNAGSFSFYNQEEIHSSPLILHLSFPQSKIVERKLEIFELSSMDFPALDDKISKNKKKRRADGKEFISSLKRRKKKKRQRKKNDANLKEEEEAKARELQIVMHEDYFEKKREMKSSNKEDKGSSKSKKTDENGDNDEKTGRAEVCTPRPAMMFCPSPDVNSKADSFIERFRAGLKLERMNSIKERQLKRTSILGRKQNSGTQQ